MQENQTEREVRELKQRLAERDQKLRKFRIGFFTLSSLLGCLSLWRCAPAVNVDYPTATASTICSGTSLLGTAGTAICAVAGTSTVTTLVTLLQSNAIRTVGTTQVSQSAEVTTYAGVAMPTGYRDVPVVSTDDDGYCNADAASLGATCTPATSVVSITYAQHIAMVTCGTTQTTIAARIADCLSKNPTVATWSGATKGISGEADWKLVTRMATDTSSGACALAAGAAGLLCVFKEVWQDQRTGLIWSSVVAGARKNDGTPTGAGMAAANWCRAAGNVENSGGVNCTAGGGQQPATAVSFCSEVLTPAITGETWVANTPGSYTYDNAKGGMGRYSSPSVMWRLPTIHDYEQAEIDGIRFVMPDMGGIQYTLGFYEWSASLGSSPRSSAWYFFGVTGNVNGNVRTNSYGVRCLGR